MISDSRERPGAPGAATVAVLAAFVVGAGALGASSVLSSALPRVLLALALIAVGWPVTRLSNDQANPLVRALGERALRGIGTSLVVLGGYLLGLALLTASAPDSPGESGPSPVVVVLLVYGMPALTLLAVATTKVRAWAIGAGAILPMLLVLLLATAEVSADAVSVTMLVVSALLTVLVFRAPANATVTDVGAAAAAMSASFAFGAGTSPFGSLGSTQFSGAVAEVGDRGLTGGAQTVVAGAALLVAAVLLVVAVLRHDLASGLLVGSMFAGPPALLQLAMWTDAWESSSSVALVVAPAIVAVVALAALRFHHFRRALVSLTRSLRTHQGPTSSSPGGSTVSDPSTPSDADGPVPRPHVDGEPTTDDAASDPEPESLHRAGGVSSASFASSASSVSQPVASSEADGSQQPGPSSDAASDAASAAAFAVVLAAAAVVFVALAMPMLTWDMRVQGVVALLVLVGAGALAYWLPGTAGAAASVVAMLGFAVASPWVRLLAGDGLGSTSIDLTVIGVADLVVAGALVWLLLRRHPRVAVYAAAAYLLAGSMAACLGSLLFDADFLTGSSGMFDGDWAPVLIVVLPLLVLAIPAAALSFGRRAAVGQAVGAVALAAGGFLPMKVIVSEFVSGDDGFALQTSLAPLTPTDWLTASQALRTVTGPALIALVTMVLVGFVLAASLASRPSAPLAAAVTLLLLSAVQASLLTALSEWSADEAEVLGWSLGAAALVAALVAVATAAAAASRERELG